MQKKNYYLESVLDLNASNVWGTEAQELLELWQKDIKEEGFSSSEEKVLNVIRLAFDVYHFDPKDDREVMRYSDGNYVILPCVDKRKVPWPYVRKRFAGLRISRMRTLNILRRPTC